MKRAAPRLTILVLTEDSGEQAHATWEILLRKTFGVLVSGTRTHLIDFDPQTDREKAATRGNRWKSTEAEDLPAIIDLRRTIATRLLEDDPPGFVLFHIDGDRPFRDREGAENPRRFEDDIRVPVETLLRERLTALGRAADVAARLRHLVVVVPYYELEAWLYQNIEEARKHCCGRPEHVALLNQWAAHRATLDEVPRPKKEALPCIADRHNEALARGFDPDVVLAAGASYEAAVMHILEHAPELVAALERTKELT